MMRRSWGIFLLAAAVAGLIAGCGGGAKQAALYRAEKAFYAARQAETEARLGGAQPDSATLLKVRERFLAVRRAVPEKYFVWTGDSTAYQALRTVGNALAQGARLAMEARRPDLALESALQLKKDAGDEPVTARQAAFLALASYRALRRHDDAIAEMKQILERFAPSEARSVGEDPILVIPETIVNLKRTLGDNQGADREMREALRYYESLLHRRLPPLVLAQARARAIMMALELGQPVRALSHADTLEAIVAANPSLRPMMAEVRFAKGRVHAMIDRDPTEGVQMLERLATDFPQSVFAPRALFEAAAQLESKGRYAEARERYQDMLRRYPDASDVAPLAMYRLGMIQDRLGDWITAKATLEGIPLRFPASQPAAEAPIAIIQHYSREGRRTAAQNYFPKALETYRSLIDRDSLGILAPLFRAKMFQIYLASGDSTGLYTVTDEMVRNNPRHPYTAQALVEVGRAANRFGNLPKGVAYLRRFLEAFPHSPLAPEVRRELKEHGY